MKTIYFTQGFVWVKNGKKHVLRGGSVIDCKSAGEAFSRAEKMSRSRYVGVVAVSQEYDEASGEYGGFNLLAKYGKTLQIQKD